MRLCLDTISFKIMNLLLNNEVRLCTKLSKGNIYICATHTRKNFEVLMLHLILKKLVNIVKINAAQAHKLHMPSVQYSVLDHRPCSLSVQLPPHTLDQLGAVVLLPAAVGERMT